MDVIEKTRLGNFVKKTNDVVILNKTSGCDKISI